MKKLSRFLLLVVTLMAFFMIMTVSSSANTSGDFKYDILDDGTVRIVGYTGSITELEIPSIIDNYIVTSIGYNAFYDNDNLRKVSIPDSVISIVYGAFDECSNLQDVVIPNSVTEIGYRAFYSCTSIQNITIPNSVTKIGDYSFGECTSLKNIIIPDSVTFIGYRAFYNTAFYNIESNWENDVLYINNHLIEARTIFVGEYIIKDDTISIADDAFSDCVGLQSIVLPDSLITIYAGTFDGCISLRSVTIPKSIKTIGDSAFYSCDNLRDVYYLGTKKQWSNIMLGVGNSSLLNATIHYKNCLHEYSVIITPPTCTEQGYTTYTCECGESYVDDYVKETGHTHNKVVTPPTCTEQGCTTYICECGDSYVIDYVDATGHSFSDWVVTKESTVDDEGEMERACSCGQKEYKSIDKLPVVEDDNNSKQEDTSKEDIKNPEIPDTNAETTNIYFVFMLMSFVFVVEIVVLSQEKRYYE